MDNLKTVVKKAKDLVGREKGDAVKPLFDLANYQGQILAKKLKADQDIVMLGTLFMDLKRKQAVKENRLQDHTKMAVDTVKKFFEQFDLDDEIKNKIYNCIEAHHGEVPFTCIEAEIVANADCYKFLHPKGMFNYFAILGGRSDNFNEVFNSAQEKLEEKWKILSLPICKKELKPYYQMFKKLFKAAKIDKI